MRGQFDGREQRPARDLWRCFTLLVPLLLPLPAFAATPIGSEFQVNTYTTGDQDYPAVATGAAGFVVVWQSAGQDGSFAGVFGQRFADTGARIGSEFQVNAFTTGSQAVPVVSSDPAGNFVVLWQSPARDGSRTAVIGRRYASTGAPVGSEFQVNTYTTNYQQDVAVAADSAGGFVVVWKSVDQDGSGAGVFGQRFASAGAALGSEFQINTFTTGDQLDPAVGAHPAGGFVVAWDSSLQDGNRFGIFAQRYGSTGAPLGTEFQVNTYTTGSQLFPAVTVDSSGRFVIVWQGSDEDGNSDGIFGQRYASTGMPLGTEFQVNSYTTNVQGIPMVATDAAGGFVAVWRSATEDGDGGGIFGQRYDSNGAALGSEFRVNAHTAGDQDSPAVAMHPSGEFVVAWSSTGQDGSDSGVFAQRFTVATPTPTTATPTTTSACTGDCDTNRRVTIDELVLGVIIALGEQQPSECPGLDQGANGRVEVNELIAAVNNSLTGCPPL